jgi:hypothetical protein
VPTAVISDIHGNAEALKRVLDDIAARKIDRIVCLGDIVGYGPEPLECVDLVRQVCAFSLMGNHDFGVLYEPTNFNPGAQAAAFWTRAQFDAEPDQAKRQERYEFLGKLRVRVVDAQPDQGAGVLFVHGSPRRPVNEYIFPDDALNTPDKMESIFSRVDRLAMVGHTHVPGVFTDEPDFYPPSELGEGASYRFQRQREGDRERGLGGPAPRPGPEGELRDPAPGPGGVRARAIQHRCDRQEDQGDPAAERVAGGPVVQRAVRPIRCSDR